MTSLCQIDIKLASAQGFGKVTSRGPGEQEPSQSQDRQGIRLEPESNLWLEAGRVAAGSQGSEVGLGPG